MNDDRFTKDTTGSPYPQPKNSLPNTRRNPNEKPWTQILLSENWKQQALVKKNSRYAPLTSLMITLQFIACGGLAAYAGAEAGGYIVPAIAAAGYTAATVNNAFDPNLHGLMGFLDSPVSEISALLCK